MSVLRFPSTAYGLSSSFIVRGDFPPADRPCYLGSQNAWYLTDYPHSLIKGPYTLIYSKGTWILDIKDEPSAVLFKLTFA